MNAESRSIVQGGGAGCPAAPPPATFGGDGRGRGAGERAGIMRAEVSQRATRLSFLGNAEVCVWGGDAGQEKAHTYLFCMVFIITQSAG